ncbi:MAG: hypothetical protein K8R92_02035 [Planctomycetes bacterium]|nr:hypothetical protein [Planctomycetota bacterium]
MKTLTHNQRCLGHALDSLAMLGAVLGLSGQLLAAEDASQKEAVVEATGELGQLVVKAHGGKLTPGQLRAQRLLVQRRMNQHLADAPALNHPKEVAEVDQARTDLNQQVMRSQEFEFFGPEDCPQWGWYPSRHIKSEGSAVKVDPAGNAVRMSATPEG